MAHDLVERSGKSYCGICNGVEGSSLPTDCPGSPLSQTQASGVYRGDLDYIGGEWINPRAPAVEDNAPTGDPPPQGNNSWNGSVTVEVEGDPDPDPRDNGNNTPIIVPVPVPVPVPMPGGQNSENDPGSQDPDPEIILDVNSK